VGEIDARTWELNEQEFGAVSALPPGDRYNHFVKRVADWEWVWVLEAPGGGLAQAASDGGPYLAVWPHPRYAEACASDDWSGTKPAAFEVHKWVNEFLPQLVAEGTMLVVFPTPEHQGFIVPPEGMKHDIEAELSLYEPPG
jgi:Protein of unknown function (DUF2750)